MKKTQRSILKFLLTVLAVVTAVFVIYIWQERFKNSNNKPAIICPSESISVSVESLSDNSILLRDVTAMDVEDGDITPSIVVESVSQFVDEGHCIITYAAFDSDNNVSKITRHLFLTDYVPPRFTIKAPLEFNYSGNFNPLNCVGAYDCVDGDISDRVKMSLVDPNDDITAMGTHEVEFKVTNSMGVISVLRANVEVYERTYTETRTIPVIKLSDYLIYVDRYGYADPVNYVSGISLNGVYYALSEYKAGSITVDDSDVDYSTPGVYTVRFSCDNRGEYVGYCTMMVIVTEVER